MSSQRAYGQLPAALPAELGLLVAEMLDGDIRGDRNASEMTREQLARIELVEQKIAESKTSCVMLVTPEFGQAAVLKRAACIRNYKALRAPILMYMIVPALASESGLASGFGYQFYAFTFGDWKAYLHLWDSSHDPQGYLHVGAFIERKGLDKSMMQPPAEWRHFALKYEIVGNGDPTSETYRTFSRDDPYALATFLSDYFWLAEKGRVLTDHAPKPLRLFARRHTPGTHGARQYTRIRPLSGPTVTKNETILG